MGCRSCCGLQWRRRGRGTGRGRGADDSTQMIRQIGLPELWARILQGQLEGATEVLILSLELLRGLLRRRRLDMVPREPASDGSAHSLHGGMHEIGFWLGICLGEGRVPCLDLLEHALAKLLGGVAVRGRLDEGLAEDRAAESLQSVGACA